MASQGYLEYQGGIKFPEIGKIRKERRKIRSYSSDYSKENKQWNSLRVNSERKHPSEWRKRYCQDH